MAATVREMMALNATELPMLMRERRQVTMKDTKMALRGTSQPDLTFSVFISCKTADV